MNSIGRNDPCPCGSGKKFKQCCMQTGSGQSASSQAQATPRTVQISRALQAALEHHQLGRFTEAESIYLQILHADPVNFDALHMLGVLAHQMGKNEQSIDIIGRAILQNNTDPLAHNNLGNAYRALGRQEEALTSFRKALSLQPDFHQVHNNLGETYRMLGRFEEAVASFQKVLAIDPGYAEAHNNLGLVRQAQGNYSAAQACFKQAIAIRPNYAKAHSNLGGLHRISGRTDEALVCFDQALRCNPDFTEALYAMAGIFKEQGNLKKALLCLQKLLQIQASVDEYWMLYAEIIKLLHADALDLIHVPTLLQCFKKPHIDPQKLERIAVALICRDAAMVPLLHAANDASDNDGTQQMEAALADGRLHPLLTMPLLLAVLEEALITHYRLEKLLLQVRRALLSSAMRANPAADELPAQRFTACLALQCFANEYVYAVTDEEQQAIAALQTQIAEKMVAGQSDGQSEILPPLMLLACYQPLHRCAFAEKIDSLSGMDYLMQRVIQRQVAEPLQEKLIKAGLPRLTSIDNAISQAVRQQYEENPYPQWRRRGTVGQGHAMHVSLQHRFPHQVFSDHSPAAPDVLVAGCGTGSDPVQIVQSFKNAQVLAIDMSLTSLAYAQRATQAIGITNITFQQADILELGTLNRQFDLVVSSGVLHHMRDPLAGWRNLVGLMRPHAYMNIGLYSRRARHEVTRVRQLIHEKGYAATLEGIRQFRTDVMSGRAGIDIGSLAMTPDFYSTSACRDLVFHVEEHLFSPLEIKAHLMQLGLTFLGFEFANPEAYSRYIARFPDNPAGDILDNWELLEIDHPEIFAGMYQFWLKKNNGATSN